MTPACQREEYALLADTHYLNCAYMSPLSRAVQESGRAAIDRLGDPSRIVARDFFTGVDELRAAFARLIGAPDHRRVAVVPAVSYGEATLARNTPLERGQNVVAASEQFPSSLHSWRRAAAEKQAVLRTVASPPAGPGRGSAWSEAILAAIDRDTAAVTLGTIHWTDGTRFDLDAIGARCREVGAALVLDGTQSVGAEPFDLDRVRPDALVCAGYKWLTGPYSLGLAWYGARYDGGVPLEETWAARMGSDDFAALVDQRGGYRPGAARYDVGEPANFVLVAMLTAAIRQVLEWSAEGVRAYVAGLVGALVRDARLEALGMAGAPPATPHLFALPLPAAADPKAVAQGLRQRGVHVAVRGRSVRVSPHVYNDARDLDALADALAATLGRPS